MMISTNQYFRLLLTWVLRASKVLDKPQTRDLNKPGKKQIKSGHNICSQYMENR